MRFHSILTVSIILSTFEHPVNVDDLVTTNDSFSMYNNCQDIYTIVVSNYVLKIHCYPANGVVNFLAFKMSKPVAFKYFFCQKTSKK